MSTGQIEKVPVSSHHLRIIIDVERVCAVTKNPFEPLTRSVLQDHDLKNDVGHRQWKDYTDLKKI